jgi:hypothetical protein
VLQEAFGLDNTPFINALEERGFFVAHDTYANYNMTRYSSPSILNMQLIDGQAIGLEGDASPESLLRENLVIKQLRDWGYHTVVFQSDLAEALRGKVDSFFEPDRILHEFHAKLIDITPIRFLQNRLNTRKQKEHGQRAIAYDIHRDGVCQKFQELETMEFGDTPHFVFAHILSPHWPFVFDANGDAVYPTVRYRLDAHFISWESPTPDEFTTGYAKQIHAVNTMTLSALDGLLEKTPNTIIILQGDHGTRRSMFADTPFPLEQRAREEHAILNAFRFPDSRAPVALSSDITPVNTFRLIFDEYFGTSLGFVQPTFFMTDPSEEEVDHDITPIIERIRRQ